MKVEGQGQGQSKVTHSSELLRRAEATTSTLGRRRVVQFLPRVARRRRTLNRKEQLRYRAVSLRVATARLSCLSTIQVAYKVVKYELSVFKLWKTEVRFHFASAFVAVAFAVVTQLREASSSLLSNFVFGHSSTM